MQLVLRKFFGRANRTTGFVDMVTTHVPSPVRGAATKVAHTYSGAEHEQLTQAMYRCDPRGPLMVNIVKLFSAPDCETFMAFGRILSGTVRMGQRVRVLGEAYSLDDEEDMVERTVASVAMGEGRYDAREAPPWCRPRWSESE